MVSLILAMGCIFTAVQALQFPAYGLRIQEQEQKKVIFDPVRKKFIPLTPEEWVRQHCIAHLFNHYQIALGMIAVEREIAAFGLRKRFDIVVFASDTKPFLLIECKAPEVEITRNTLIQAATYNNKLDSRFVWITNGLQHAWFEKQNGNLHLIAPPESLALR
ncbi:MAG: type I restriction enzyme HsdR N-terminal domain-containing protein [Bacteroidota bacterium]